MKRPLLILISAVFSFGVGLAAVQIFRIANSPERSLDQSLQAPVISADHPLASVEIQALEEGNIEESNNALDNAWVEADLAEYGKVSVTRECMPSSLDWATCELKVRENGRTRRTFHSEQPSAQWLRFGFFDFLGKGNDQLIVQTYSGGAHCCFDYVIFDLEPGLRVIYDSSKYDSASEIGSDLVPVDIDSDGVYEFRQRIEAFSYFHASYAGSNKPTAVFAYNVRAGVYELANKRFPDYVLADTQRLLVLLRENPQMGDDVFFTREKFLNLIYSGDREDAWKYFEENYNFKDKAEYRRDVRNLFKTEPVYFSIYGRDRNRPRSLRRGPA